MVELCDHPNLSACAKPFLESNPLPDLGVVEYLGW